jgi:predicted metalloprotease with PDZ domain
MSFDITYRIQPAAAHAHLFEISLEIARPDATHLTFSLPAWIPGSYMIRDFAKHIISVAAESADGRPLGLQKCDKQTWICAAESGPIRIRSRVYAGELSVRSAHLDACHAYFNGSSLLFRVHGMEAHPCRIELLAPPAPVGADWRVATSLEPISLDARGFGHYRADDYADLIDHPVEMGRFDMLQFEVLGVPHRMAISGRHHADRSRLEQDLARVCREHAGLFDALPIERYLFLVQVVGEGYGGLEHRRSTSLICSRQDLPRTSDAPRSEGYVRFLGLCSHEYFHLWNVKRIAPQVLKEASLEREAHTRTLWAFEGITSYYDDLALVRSGCIDAKTYLGLLAATITRLLRTPGRGVQTVAESSFDAWTKFYKQDENAPNAVVSYYVKGALVALALDLTLRGRTAGRVSLDDVMRALWDRYGRSGIGVPERGVEAMATEVSGLDLDDFFARALDSTAALELELEPLLAEVGIECRLRPANGAKDLGRCVESFEACEARPSLEVRLRPGTSEVCVQSVLNGGAGEEAGIAPGDILLAVDGVRVTAETLDSLVATAHPDAGLPIHLFRRDELIELRAFPRPARVDTCDLMPLESVSESVLRAREHWLASRCDG